MLKRNLVEMTVSNKAVSVSELELQLQLQNVDTIPISRELSEKDEVQNI